MKGRKEIGDERIRNAQVQSIIYKSTSGPFSVDLSKLGLWVIGFKIRNEGTAILDLTIDDQANNTWQLNAREILELQNHPDWRRKEKLTLTAAGAGTFICSVLVEALDIT